MISLRPFITAAFVWILLGSVGMNASDKKTPPAEPAPSAAPEVVEVGVWPTVILQP